MPNILDNIRKTATKKLGPLPVWGWGVVGAGGILVARNIRDSKPSTVATGNGLIPGASGTQGAAEVEESQSIFVSTPGFTIEGPPGDVGGIIDRLLPPPVVIIDQPPTATDPIKDFRDQFPNLFPDGSTGQTFPDSGILDQFSLLKQAGF